MKVGYLGPKGSFTYLAASNVFTQAEKLPFSTIVNVLKEVETGAIDWGVVPIENSIEGTVNQTLDFLYHYSTCQIQGEVVLPIEQNLLVHSNWMNALNKIDTVMSHPQALAQTQMFLSEHFKNIPQKLMDSTTQAAKWVSENSDKPTLAIASKEAANMYGLEVVYENIQDITANHTRFWIVGNKKLSLEYTSKKQSIGVRMKKNESGNLHKILSAFSWRDINLLKIESRPMKTMLGEYFFLIDIEVNNQKLIDLAVEEITELGGEVKLLGSYPVCLKFVI
ncbi:prephenate dehydratase [Vagococcus sp.]|uniref:prephenate dehydratase n=1 Tax=Vagococcus sp. TaxID=1933889 RepID=UPI002FCB6810